MAGVHFVSMSDANVHIVLSGRISFEDDITMAQAVQVLAYLNGQGLSPSLAQDGPGVLDLRSDTSTAPSAPSAPPTPRDVLQVTGAKTNVEKIVALAGYFTQAESTSSFTVNDVRQAFRRAREPLPGNLNRDVESAIKAGLLAESETRGEFYLTRHGDEALQTGFAVPGRPRSARSGSGGRARTASAPPELSALTDLPERMEGTPSFHEVALKRDKVLWVLAAAKAAGIDGLSNRGIEWLTDQYGDGVQAKHVGVNFDALRRLDYVNRSLQDQTMRILPKGEAYLRSLATGSTG
jgi:hypothetical protein